MIAALILSGCAFTGVVSYIAACIWVELFRSDRD